VIERQMRYYNTERRRSGLDYRAPVAHLKKGGIHPRVLGERGPAKWFRSSLGAQIQRLECRPRRGGIMTAFFPWSCLHGKKGVGCSVFGALLVAQSGVRFGGRDGFQGEATHHIKGVEVL